MIAELLSKELASIQTYLDSGPKPWAVVKTRQDSKCAECGEWIKSGSEAFRPVGNGKHRYRRLCVGCVLTAVLRRRTRKKEL